MFLIEGVSLMKKQYVAPEFDNIIFDIEDIITHSLATSSGDGNINGEGWWADGANIYDAKGNKIL